MTLYCLIHLAKENTTVGQTTDPRKALEFALDNCPGEQCRAVYRMPYTWKMPAYARALRVNYQTTQRLVQDIINPGTLLTTEDLRKIILGNATKMGKKDAALLKHFDVMFGTMFDPRTHLNEDQSTRLAWMRAAKAYRLLCAMAGVDPKEL